MINEKNKSELETDISKLRIFEFRAVSIKRKGEENEYSSVPIREAKNPYTTIGLYEVVKEGESTVRNHVVDMSPEEFRAVTESRFPQDFESWQQTHFEIVENLVDLSRLKPEEQPDFFRPLFARFGKAICYAIAKDWTEEFEKAHKKGQWENDFEEEVRKFVQQKVKEEEQLWNPRLT